MSTKSTIKRVNLLGSDMVEIFITDMYEGDTTNVLPYKDVRDAYINHTSLFNWDSRFTYQIIKPLFK